MSRKSKREEAARAAAETDAHAEAAETTTPEAAPPSSGAVAAAAPAGVATPPEPAATPATTPGTRATTPATTPATRLTPAEIQQKVFRGAFRGYAEREVDVFLDQVTEEMARLIAEDRALRERLERAEMRATTPLPTDADAALINDARGEAARLIAESRAEAGRIVDDAARDAERIRVDAHSEAGRMVATGAAGAVVARAADGTSVARADKTFLHREREFLQGLAGLIQGHAEAIKDDLRKARETGDGPATQAREIEPAQDEVVDPGSDAPGDQAEREPSSEPPSEPALAAEAEVIASIGSEPAEPPVVGAPFVGPAELERDPEPDPRSGAAPGPSFVGATVSAAPAPSEGSGPAPRTVDISADEAQETPVPAELLEVGAPDAEAAGAARLIETDPAPTSVTGTLPSQLVGTTSARTAAPAQAPAVARAAPASGQAKTAPPPTPPKGAFGAWIERRSEPAPGGTEDEDGHSLRELFWGEE